MPGGSGEVAAPAWAPAGWELPSSSTRRGLVVRASEGARDDLAAWVGADTVVVFDGDLDRLHLELSMLGPFDVLVDASGGASAPARWRCTLHHLRAGGTGLVRLPAPGTRPRLNLDQYLDQHLDQRIAQGGEEVDRHARSVVVRQMSSPLVRLADAELTAEALALRPGLGRVVLSRPAARVLTDGSLRSTAPDEVPVPDRLAPELVVRELHDVTCGPRSLVTADGLVLPDTFRRPERPHLDHPHLVLFDPATSLTVDGADGADIDPPDRLPGRWFHADNFFRGHFGHAMTEQLSKFWAWPELRATWPDLGVLVSARPGAEVLASWEVALLEAVGVPEEAVHVHHRPVTVEHLVTATPGFAITGYLHPAVREVYDRVGRALTAEATSPAAPDRVFLTRAADRRGCRNAEEVHELVEGFGFTVLQPEDLSLVEQVTTVRQASVVAGFGGSAMLHVALGEHPQRVLLLSHTHYHCANEKFLCGLRGHDLSIYRSVSDLSAQEHGKAAFHSSFRFDLEREGVQFLADLRAL